MDITNLQNQVTLVEDDLARATTPADFRRLSTLIDETTELTIQQIRNYSNAGGIADKRKLETILNRCKYLDARIKQSLIKTGEGVSGGSDESSVTYYDLESAFKGRIKTGIVINNNILDPKEFLEEAQPLFVDKIEASLQKRIPNMKANVVLCADYKMKLDDTVQAKYFNTSNFIISRSSDLISIFRDMEISLLSQMESFEEVGSGGTLSRINSLAININKYSPLRASKFIELPTVIKSKHAIINVKNMDNECFYYALVSALYPSSRNKELPSSYPQNFKQLFNIKGIKSPVKITDIPKFERQNPNISVNVYGLQGSKVMGPLYHTKSKKQHHINLLYVRKRKASHYCWIKNMSRLCRSSITKYEHRTFICDRCLRHFRSVQSLNNHLDDCEKFDAVRIEFDKPGENTLSFKNLNFNLRHPFVVYADFECLTVPCNQIDDDDDDVTHFKSCTIPYQKHIPFAVAYQVVCSFDPSLSHYKSYVGTNPQKWLVNELIKETAIIEEKIKINIPMLPLTLEEQQGYDNTTLCPHCLQEFNEDLVVKVRNHDHFTGKFLSALCQNCNLQYKCGNYIPILFHNMSGYDIHFIINELNFNREPVNILPVTRENYISVSKKCAKLTWRFIDSYRFLARSLDVLANNLAPEMFNFVREAFPNPEQFNLVRRKGIFCYDYMNSWEKLNETELPPKESFYNALREEHISCEDYEHVQNVWKTFNIKSLAQYSELYLKCDVKILADVFEQFRDLCMKIYDLDSVHFYTGPGLAWSAALKCTRVKLDLLTDIDMVLFFEKAIRGGITQCSHRYAKANNKYMKENYNEKEPSSCLLYVDANNLYGYAMSESLPYGNFEWLSENRVREIENILENFKCEEKPDWEMYTDRACMLALNMAVDEEEAPTSLILEVDLNVPREIQDKTANYLCFGLQPVWFHATNIALHATACILFTRVCLCVAGLKPPFATLAGLLFAVHPIHTEAVTGIVGRADVLACVFFLVSLLAYHGQPDGICHVWTSVILGGLSMLAKETGITVFILNLAYDFYRCWPNVKKAIVEVRWTRETRQFANRAAKVLTSLGILLAVRLALLQGSLPKFSQQDNPTAFHPSLYVRILTFCYLAAFNWWLLLCPATLSHDWQMGSVPLVTSLSDSRNLVTCLFFGFAILLSVRSLIDFEAQKHIPLVLGLLLLVLPFLPATNLVVTVGFVVAERVLYIPSLGCVLLVVYGIQLLWNANIRHRQTIAGLIILLLTASSFRIVIRNKDWRSRESLLRAGLLTLPHNAKMHYNFGNFLRDTDRPELAIAHYNVALRLWPTYASAHNNLGTLISNEAEAEEHFLAALRYSADHVNAHYNLGQLYRKTNRTSESERMLKRCIRLEPTFTPAYIELARLGGPSNPSVGPLLVKVASLNPSDPYYTTLYAHWLLNRGSYIAAIKYYWKGLSISPFYQESMLGASRILRKFGQYSRLFQLITRWQSIFRLRRGEAPLNPHLYLHGWQLKAELSGKAKAYDNEPHHTVLTDKLCVPFRRTETYPPRTNCSTNCTCGTCSKTVLWTNYSPVRRCNNNNRTRSPKYKPNTPVVVQHLLDAA